MKRLLHEPLVHFLAIGALLFAVYGMVSRADRDPDAIVVGQGQIAMMTAVFERTWKRAPTAEEVDGLIDGYVREEILYREGLAMGLDRDDQVIRRRVQQKIEFLTESIDGTPEPTAAALQAYLDQHHERFARPARITLRQVYLGPMPATDSAGLLARLNELGDSNATAEMGRATQLEPQMSSATPAEIERTFGTQFAQSVAALPTGGWRGPIESEYGAHFVWVNTHEPQQIPALDEVSELVKRDWQKDELVAASERRYQALRARHTVRVERQRIALAQ